MALLMAGTLAAYFLILYIMARRTQLNASDNETFFRGRHQSPWYMVGFGMIGASISGVSFISVPGWVESTGMTYLQMCAGFFVGYLAVAFILLPLYYRLRLTSIYSWLGTRFGQQTHRTGATFFLLSKLTGASARLFIVCVVLQQLLLPEVLQQSEWCTLSFIGIAALFLLLIYIYTRRGGIFTLVRTDAFQTFCLLAAMGMILVLTVTQLGLNFEEAIQTIADNPMARIMNWDAESRQYFWRQFLSGVFIVIVMTGLDQDMMQKNLTCRSLREAQKNMCTYGACFLPVNMLLLALGILLHALCSTHGIEPPTNGDALLPMLVENGALGTLVIVPFSIGIVAAAFSSADSALTSLTTCLCIDILRIEERGLSTQQQTAWRKRVHIAICCAALGCILLFSWINNTNIINAIYVMASYTYGPLLGLYAFGMLCCRPVRDKFAPIVCLAAPLLCALLDRGAPLWWNYTFGYELLMLNGFLTFIGLWSISSKKQSA